MTVPSLQAVDVASADELCGLAVGAEENHNRVAVGMCDVAIDITRVGRDVVGVHLGGRGMGLVGPLAVIGTGILGETVFVTASG